MGRVLEPDRPCLVILSGIGVSACWLWPKTAAPAGRGFVAAKDDTCPGTIDLRLPDDAHHFVAGTFTAELKSKGENTEPTISMSKSERSPHDMWPIEENAYPCGQNISLARTPHRFSSQQKTDLGLLRKVTLK